MTISDLLVKLGSKAGLNMADPKYATILAVSTDFPIEDANKIMGALMSVDDAKNNSDLKRHFTAAILDGADQEMVKLMDEMGLEVSDKDELKAEKNTYTRIGKLTKKIQALEAKKAGATTGEKKELSDKINSLTTQIGEIQKGHGEEIKKINSDWQGKLTNSTIRSILAGKKYANTNMSADVNVEMAMILLNKELEKVGAKIVNSNGILSLKQSKDESLDWLNSANEKPSFEQFADGVLAANKLLAVTESGSGDSGNAGGQNNNGAGNNGVPLIPGGKQINGQNFFASLERSINDQGGK